MFSHLVSLCMTGKMEKLTFLSNPKLLHRIQYELVIRKQLNPVLLFYYVARLGEGL